jgi:short-subunit dehydrogenase
MGNRGSIAVITGASSGIGRATAEEFAKQGYELAVTARRKELLDSLVDDLKVRFPKVNVKAFKCDITRFSEVMQLAADVEKEWGRVHILVNNAGAYEYKPLEKSTQEKLDELIDVNVKGVVYVTKAFIPLLKKASEKKEWAKIVNVSSISGLWGFSNMSVYTATKFAVAGFSSGLRRELRPAKIHVATIFPGPVDTKGTQKKNGSRKVIMSPSQVAKQIFDLSTGTKDRMISHPAFVFLNAIEPFSPETVDRLLKRLI